MNIIREKELIDYNHYVAALEELVKVPKNVQKSGSTRRSCNRYRSFNGESYKICYKLVFIDAEDKIHAIEKIYNKYSFWNGEKWVIYARIAKLELCPKTHNHKFYQDFARK